MGETIVLNPSKSPFKKRTAEHLRPYQFKKGNRVNPKGRPKSVLTKHERLELLSAIANLPIKTPVTAGDKIKAIEELNRMEGIYNIPLGLQGNLTYNIIIAGEDAKEKLQRLLSGEVPPLKPAMSQTSKMEGNSGGDT